MKTLLILIACAASACAQNLLTQPALPPATARAIRASENAQGLRNAILGGLRHSIDDLWSSDYAANVETAAALGAHGAELYQLYGAFFTSTRALLVASGDTASVTALDALAAKVPALTVNADGTLTITPPAEPEVVTE